ncbi:MAG: 30S ribosomal protein S6 [Clostridiaceae bacterium]|jgi:small subunit ribosomal protein S6|nr:30S ribosomal protein S6 [Clostridiaceae bacterium]
MTRKYELLYVLNGTLRTDQLKAQMQRVQELVESVAEGIVEKVEWGRRRLAYEIQDVRDGYYVIVHFYMNPENASELERLLRINDAVMRYLIVLAEGSFMPSGRRTIADEEADQEKETAKALEAEAEAAAEASEEVAEGDAPTADEVKLEDEVPVDSTDDKEDVPAETEETEEVVEDSDEVSSESDEEPAEESVNDNVSS